MAAPGEIRDGMHPLSVLRELSVQAKQVANRIELAVGDARSQGFSWELIAAQIYADGVSGRRALGDLFPGGTSTTTIRRTYERRTS